MRRTKNKSVTVELSTLFDLSCEGQLAQFQEIIDCFDLGDLQLTNSCLVEQDSELLKFSKVKIMKTHKRFFSEKTNHEIEINIDSKSLKEFAKIAAEEDITLCIIPADKSNSQIEILVNDNGHTIITFDTEKYCENEIKTKLKQILKRTT